MTELKPRNQEVNEPTSTFLEYFEALRLVNRYDDVTAAWIFRASVNYTSHAASIIREISDEERDSFIAIKEALVKAGKPARMTAWMALMSIKREQNESLDQLGRRVTVTVNEVYGEHFDKAHLVILARDFLLWALPQHFRTKILASGDIPNTLSVVKDRAAIFKFGDNSEKTSYPLKKKSTRCNYCGMLEHIEERCRKRAREGGERAIKHNNFQTSSIATLKERPFLPIIVNNHKLHALVDSGSELCLLPRRFDTQKIGSAQCSSPNGAMIQTYGSSLFRCSLDVIQSNKSLS